MRLFPRNMSAHPIMTLTLGGEKGSWQQYYATTGFPILLARNHSKEMSWRNFILVKSFINRAHLAQSTREQGLVQLEGTQ